MRIETERLILRDWQDEDIPRYARIIGDPEVRRFFVEVGTYADAESGIARARERLVLHGFTMNAVERKADGAFIGMLGIAPLKDNLKGLIRGKPDAEIGWQFGREFWGHGYAPEGARAVLDQAWEQGLGEIVAITYIGNGPSRRVMEKIGMTRSAADDFSHPEVPEGHPLRHHVLYRISNPRVR